MNKGRFYQERIQKLKEGQPTNVQVQLIGELIDDGAKAENISKDANLKNYHVRHCARVHKKLIPEVKDLFDRGKISFSHVRSIASQPNDKQEPLARDVIAKNISVHLLRNSNSLSTNNRLIRDLEKLANNYSEHTGLDIKIIPDAKDENSGTWILKYYSLDDFDFIKSKLIGETPEF